MTDASEPGEAPRPPGIETELFGSEAFVRALIDGAGDGIFMVDPDGRFLFVNDFIARSSGYPKEAFVGRSFLELVREEDREATRVNFERALAGEAVPAYELAYHTASGETMWVEINSARVCIGEEVRGVLAISRNLQRRKRIEEELLHSEEKYRTLVETLPHMVVILQGSRVVFANEAARRRFGVDSGEEADVLAFATPGERERVREIVRRRMAGEEGPSAYQATILDRDGQELPVEVHARGIQYQGRPAVQYVLTDLHERRQLERQVQHAQRMEALGVLAGGIAHDFNNHLTAILATAELIRRRHAPGDPDFAGADLICRAAERSAALTQQLLGFARKSKPQRQQVDVGQLAAEACEMLDRTLEKRTTLVLERDGESLYTVGDAGQLHQVLTNLVVNARDAMPSGGELVVRVDRATLDDPALLDAFGLSAGEFLRVVVRDSGEGIPLDITQRVFEPFFTTKADGGGSGMGLAVVYGILRAHGAAIEIESEPGEGTTVSVYLRPAPPPDPKPASRVSVPRGEGVVLLVDDEPLVRETARRVLESLGYAVVACASGPEAIERHRGAPGQVDLALVDVRMPGMDGWECQRALRRIDPDLPVIMTSGHGDAGTEPSEADQLPFLAKPYTLRSLATAIAQHLRGRRATAPEG